MTCSEDGFVKLWGTKEQVNFTNESSPQNEENFGIRNFLKKRKPIRIGAICVGEMLVHSNSINAMIQLDEASFASCGSDQLIILWKDGEIQSKVRNNFAAASLFHNQSFFSPSNKNKSFSSTSSFLPSSPSSPSSPSHLYYNPNLNSSQASPNSSPSPSPPDPSLFMSANNLSLPFSSPPYSNSPISSSTFSTQPHSLTKHLSMEYTRNSPLQSSNDLSGILFFFNFFLKNFLTHDQ